MWRRIKRWIRRIPVLGYLAGIVVSVCRLPKLLSALQEQQERLSEADRMLREQRACMEALAKEYHQKETGTNESLLKLDGEIQAQKAFADDLRDQIASKRLFYEGAETVTCDDRWMEGLNLKLSVHPTLWGPRERLHISESASMISCFFNTNSGEITVGDYSFAGSGVSLLAGSHDLYLEGLPRRDAEIRTGCDIVIGKGVWLGSGCTILGPCVIGDNAVIGAGAVVTAGTSVPQNTLWAGVPAKMVRTIETGNSADSSHVRDAVKRENGILFVSGWSEKRMHRCGGQEVCGHWMTGSEALIYTDRETLCLLCCRETTGSAEPVLERLSASEDAMMSGNANSGEIIFRTGYGEFKTELSQGDTLLRVPLGSHGDEPVNVYGDEPVGSHGNETVYTCGNKLAEIGISFTRDEGNRLFVALSDDTERNG